MRAWFIQNSPVVISMQYQIKRQSITDIVTKEFYGNRLQSLRNHRQTPGIPKYTDLREFFILKSCIVFPLYPVFCIFAVPYAIPHCNTKK